MSVKHWGEDPVGNWTIRVSDIQREKHHGRFLGWNMVFWGSAVDPSRATKFDLQPTDEYLLPPAVPPRPVIDKPSTTATDSQSTSSTAVTSGTATTDQKPTSSPTSGAPAESSTSQPTADQGWFPDMSSLMTSQKWFFGALGAVVVFGLGVGIFFWRRRVAARGSSNYSALAGEEVSMANRGGGVTAGGSRPTRELYDAFGELSDDDEYDEHAALRPNGSSSVRGANLGFHSGFLDDDEPSAPLTAAPIYRDDPESPPTRRESSNSESVTSSSSDQGTSGSAGPGASTNGSSSNLTESWEHASRTL